MSDDYETHELELAFQAGAASRDAEVQRLQMALADTEALELGTAEKCDQLREQVEVLREALDVCAETFSIPVIRETAKEALAATEPKP